MSREQIEQIEQIYSAFNRGDFDSVLESWDDDTEFVAPEDMPEQSSFRGPRGYRQFLASMLDVFEEFRSEPERIIEVGEEKYLVFVTERFRRKADATAVEAHNFVLFTMRGEKLRRLQVFLDRRTALDAAGLSDEAVRGDHVP
jgi:ketosteroid isomerase-like protein